MGVFSMVDRSIGAHYRVVALTGLMLLASFGVFAGGNPSSAQNSRELDFAKDIRPVLEARCFGCHGAQQQINGLRLDSKEGMLRGGKAGPAILPGRGSESLLYRKVTGTAEGSPMPLSGDKLTQEQIDSIRTWIDQG